MSGWPSCLDDGGLHCLQKFTHHSEGTDLLQRFQWLHENKGRGWDSGWEESWPFKHGQCCVPRVFNGDRKGRRKNPLYMLFSIAACAIVLSLLPDRSPETEQERQRGGKEGHRGGLEQERGVLYPKRQSFGALWVWSE